MQTVECSCLFIFGHPDTGGRAKDACDVVVAIGRINYLAGCFAVEDSSPAVLYV